MQNLLKLLVVSWGYESLAPGNSRFIDHHEWWGTRNLAAFLSVPAAIEFQEKYNWDKVRDDCHILAREAQQRICDLTGLAPLHSGTDGWFCQMFTAPLKADTDIVSIKDRVYNEYCIEVPLIDWNGYKLIRVSIQGYNSHKDVDALLIALEKLL